MVDVISGTRKSCPACFVVDGPIDRRRDPVSSLKLQDEIYNQSDLRYYFTLKLSTFESKTHITIDVVYGTTDVKILGIGILVPSG